MLLHADHDSGGPPGPPASGPGGIPYAFIVGGGGAFLIHWRVLERGRELSSRHVRVTMNFHPTPRPFHGLAALVTTL